MLQAAARAEGANAGQVRAAEALERTHRRADHRGARRAGHRAMPRSKTVRDEAARAGAGHGQEDRPRRPGRPARRRCRGALRQAMHQAIGEPRITLRAAPAVIEALEPRLAEIAHEEGYEGRVHDRRRSRHDGRRLPHRMARRRRRTQRTAPSKRRSPP